MNAPTPNAVALTVAYRRQVQSAQSDTARRRNARRNGYAGPLTRNELAYRINAQATRR